MIDRMPSLPNNSKSNRDQVITVSPISEVASVSPSPYTSADESKQESNVDVPGSVKSFTSIDTERRHKDKFRAWLNKIGYDVEKECYDAFEKYSTHMSSIPSYKSHKTLKDEIGIEKKSHRDRIADAAKKFEKKRMNLRIF